MTRGQDPPRDPGNQRELSSREAGGSSGLGLHHRGQNGRGGLQIVVVKLPLPSPDRPAGSQGVVLTEWPAGPR